MHSCISNLNTMLMHLSLNTFIKIRPIVNQVECHAYLSQEKLLKFCQKHGIQLVAYSPLGSPGRLWASPNETHLLNDPVLEGIKLKHNKTAAQILIRWQVRISWLSEKYKSYCIISSCQQNCFYAFCIFRYKEE